MKKKRKRKTVKQRISALGPAIPGTIRKVRLKCGKQGCRCQSGREADKHGPYYFWDRKEDGRLTSSSIPKDCLGDFRKWIRNRKSLEKLVDRLLVQGQKRALKRLETA